MRFNINSGISEVYVAVPQNIDDFINQKKIGLFRGCLLKSMNRKNQKSFIPASFVHRIAEFRDFLRELNMTSFLFGETLLGWKRECNIIPYTTTIELAVSIEEFRESFIEKLRTSKFKPHSIIGKVTSFRRYSNSQFISARRFSSNWYLC